MNDQNHADVASVELPSLHLQLDGPAPWCVVGSAYDEENGGTDVTAVYGPVSGPEQASELLNHLEALGLGVSQKLEVVQTFPVTTRGAAR